MSTVIDFFHSSNNYINKKIFGVSFPGIAGSWSGTRLYDSVGKQFSPSYGYNPGIDEFITEKNSPFDICEVMLNSSNGEVFEVGTEKDSNWEDLLVLNRYDSNTNPNPLYNHMVRFPKFYYKRPSKWEFQVSGYPHEGFLPSPMHYRNGKMYDYCYISKYLLTTSLTSQTGIPIINSDSSNFFYEPVRNTLRSQGFYILDYAAHCSLLVLMMIKYNTVNIAPYIGIGYTRSNIDVNGASLNIPSKDGYTLSNPTSYDGSNVVFGLEGYYEGGVWTQLEGAFVDNQVLYVNTDIENIISNPSAGDPDYKQIAGTVVQLPNFNQYYFTDIMYDPDNPIYLMPTGATSSPSNSCIPNIVYAGGASFSNIWVGGGYHARISSGPFDVHYRALFTGKDAASSYRSMTFA